MSNHFRLVGGPRDSDVTTSLPIEYTVVTTETFSRLHPDHNDIFYEDTRFVATWRGDEAVYLTVGPEYNNGELVRRADLPDDAMRAALQLDSGDIEGAAPSMYDVHTVDR